MEYKFANSTANNADQVGAKQSKADQACGWKPYYSWI